MAGYQYDAELDSRDRSLWSRLIEGDKSALGLLFDHYATELFSYGYHICGERELVKDVIQDVFVELWTYHPRLSPDVKVKFYLYRCVRNALHGYREKDHTVTFRFPEGEPLIDSAPSAETLIVDEERSSFEKDVKPYRGAPIGKRTGNHYLEILFRIKAKRHRNPA